MATRRQDEPVASWAGIWSGDNNPDTRLRIDRPGGKYAPRPQLTFTRSAQGKPAALPLTGGIEDRDGLACIIRDRTRIPERQKPQAW